MSWRRWKLGILVSVILSLLVAGSGWTAGTKWQALIPIFCTAMLTHFVSFVKDHPVDRISFDTERLVKPPEPPAEQGDKQ